MRTFQAERNRAISLGQVPPLGGRRRATRRPPLRYASRVTACRVESAVKRRERAAERLALVEQQIAAVEATLAERRARLVAELAAEQARKKPRARTLAALQRRLVALDECHPRRRRPTQRPIVLRSWPAVALVNGEAPVRARVVPLGSVITSHDPETWREDPRYPPNTQERRYHADPVEQLKVQRIARTLRPELLLTQTPSPLDGPPVVVDRGDGTWIALGGNGRTMALRWAASRGLADQYEGALRQLVRRPVLPGSILVRELVDAPPAAEWPRWSRDLNRQLGAGVDLSTAATSLARSLPASVARALVHKDLAAALRSATGREVLAILQRQGLVGASERGLFDEEGLSEQGRALVRAALAAAILGNTELVEALPARVVTQVAAAAPAVLVAAEVGGPSWDLRPAIQAAARDFADAVAFSPGAAPVASVRRWLSSPHLVAPDTLGLALGPATLVALAAGKLAEVADAFAIQAEQNPEGQSSLFGSGPTPPARLESLVSPL